MFDAEALREGEVFVMREEPETTTGARERLRRPPELGALRRMAEAQALTLRPELRAVMQARGLALEQVARLAKLDVETLQAFVDGAAINPRWQEKLASWLEHAYDAG